jgi:hypothetical protein
MDKIVMIMTARVRDTIIHPDAMALEPSVPPRRPLDSSNQSQEHWILSASARFNTIHPVTRRLLSNLRLEHWIVHFIYPARRKTSGHYPPFRKITGYSLPRHMNTGYYPPPHKITGYLSNYTRLAWKSYCR